MSACRSILQPVAAAGDCDQLGVVEEPVEDGCGGWDIADQLGGLRQQLEAVTEERGSLAEKAALAEVQAKRFEGEKTAFEAQVMNLKDKIVDIDGLHTQLDEMTTGRTDLGRQVQNLSSRLEAANTSKDTLGASLAGTNQTLHSLRGEVQNLRDKLGIAES